MNTDLLRVFVTVAESESLSDASEKLSKTQSSVTKSIKRLEELVNGSLFNRDNYRLILNDRGKALLNTAIEVLQQENSFLNLAAELNTGTISTQVISYDAIIPFDIIQAILKKYELINNSKNFKLIPRVLTGAYQLVEDGIADLAITGMLKNSGDLDVKYIDELEIVNVVSTNQENDFWKQIPQCILTDYIGTEPESNMMTISKQIHTSSIENKANLIKSGIAWGRVPYNLVQDSIEAGDLYVANAPGVSQKSSITIALVFSKSYVMSVSNT